jgi:hypothetical protein
MFAMSRAGRIAAQIIAYGLFAVSIGYFSNSPVYTYLDPDLALIKLSFSHAGQRKEECRRLTPEEIAALAPNMRQALDCPRERMPVVAELALDGITLLSKSYRPTGLAKDGASSAYERLAVNPGQHQLTVRLRDSNREQGFDYEKDVTINLSPRQNFVIDFRDELGGFLFY